MQQQEITLQQKDVNMQQQEITLQQKDVNMQQEEITLQQKDVNMQQQEITLQQNGYSEVYITQLTVSMYQESNQHSGNSFGIPEVAFKNN
jgi:hypothetical protein